MFFVELAGAVIILSVLTCIFKDFVLKCLKLAKIIHNFKKLGEINLDAYKNSVTEGQIFLILISTAVIGILILITGSPFIINVPVYLVTLLICWYCPLESELKSESIFKTYSQRVKLNFDVNELVAYLSISDEDDINPKDEYWNNFTEVKHKYKRVVAALVCNNNEIHTLFPTTFKSICKDPATPPHTKYWYLYLRYNVLNKHEITKYLDI
jgi:hypothetical protein